MVMEAGIGIDADGDGNDDAATVAAAIWSAAVTSAFASVW